MQNALILAIPLLAALLCTPTNASNSTIAQRAQQIEALNEQHPRPDDLVFADTMRREYANNFSAIDDVESLHHESNDDLKRHWDAAATAMFYSADSSLLNAALRVFGELHQRNLTDTKATISIYNGLLKARRFDAAIKLTTAYPTLAPATPIRFIDAGTKLPSVWKLNADANEAKRMGIDLNPLQIIVVAGCHFSDDAANDIVTDPLLSPIFAQHARWLSLSPGEEQLDALTEWNRRHPQTPLLPIYDRSEWALITQWEMPTFVIVKDGKVIDSTRGWKSGEAAFRQQLVALLQRTGFLEQSGP